MNPIIFPINKKCNINYRCKIDNGEYYLTILSVNHAYDKEIDTYIAPSKIKVDNNKLSCQHNFEEAGEYIITLNGIKDIYLHTDNATKEREAIFCQHIFALNEDDFNLRPIKIDFHVHSNFSDGSLSPQEVICRYRYYGMNDIAITDHHTMEGAFLSVKQFKNMGSDYNVFLGEESHTNNCYPHIVNWGAEDSVCAYIKNNKENYLYSLKEIIQDKKLQNYKYPVCIADMIFRINKIKEYNGLPILAHPLWKVTANILEKEVFDYAMDNKLFDCMELVSGQTFEENCKQINRYFEFLRNGNDISYIGASDAHEGQNPNNNAYTILLVKENNLEGIKQAIAKRKTGAVDAHAKKFIMVYTNYRYSDYMFFLTKYYFPEFKYIYKKESSFLREYLKNTEKYSLSPFKEKENKIIEGLKYHE